MDVMYVCGVPRSVMEVIKTERGLEREAEAMSMMLRHLAELPEGSALVTTETLAAALRRHFSFPHTPGVALSEDDAKRCATAIIEAVRRG